MQVSAADFQNCCCNCPPGVVPGCTDPAAANYNPAAQWNDGSCIYPEGGCTDPTATNYNPAATWNDGSCIYPPRPENAIPGCTDPTASNYNPAATWNDGSCLYPPYILGCTDPSADNYNPSATVNDGSCVYTTIPEIPMVDVEIRFYSYYPGAVSLNVALNYGSYTSYHTYKESGLLSEFGFLECSISAVDTLILTFNFLYGSEAIVNGVIFFPNGQWVNFDVKDGETATIYVPNYYTPPP